MLTLEELVMMAVTSYLLVSSYFYKSNVISSDLKMGDENPIP